MSTSTYRRISSSSVPGNRKETGGSRGQVSAALRWLAFGLLPCSVILVSMIHHNLMEHVGHLVHSCDLPQPFDHPTTAAVATAGSKVSVALPEDHDTSLAAKEVQAKVPPTTLDSVRVEPSSNGFPLAHDEAKTSSTKPKLIFHVGTPKTASTFLQCSLCSNHEQTDPLLLQDNWVFLGTCPFVVCNMTALPPQFMIHRFGAFISHGAPEAWQEEKAKLGPSLHPELALQRQNVSANVSPKLVHQLEQAAAKQQNALIIYEGATDFPDFHIRALAETMNELFQVRVVVAYRPLYDWLPSKYNSVLKDKIGKFWPHEVFMRPGNKGPKVGIEVPPFDLEGNSSTPVVNGFYQMMRDIEVDYHQHQAETVATNYRRHFQDVTFMDMHRLWGDNPEEAEMEGDPTLAYLACRVMKAEHTCETARANLFPPATSDNQSVDLNNDHIAVAAFEAGLLPKEMPRNFASQSIKLFRQEQDLKDIPLKCHPAEKMNRLLELSLSLEKQLYGSNWKDEYEQAHRAGFAKKSSKLCAADTDAILADTKWREFFQSLEVVPGMRWTDFRALTEEKIENDKKMKAGAKKNAKES